MKIGKIISIDFNKIKVRIATEIRGNSVNIRGAIYYFGNISSYLKTTNAVNEEIVCEVLSISDTDPHKERQSFNMESERELELKPLGTITRNEQEEKLFQLGIGIYPSLYSDVSIVTNEDMNLILTFKDGEKDGNTKDENGNTKYSTFFLGTSKSLINYPVNININKFFQIHSAVVGNSGSGKSNSIAHIIQDIFKNKDYAAYGAKIILFDVNGEYKNAFSTTTDKTNGINIKYYQPINSLSNPSEEGYQPFFMPHFLLNLDEWCGFLLATEATQRPFWEKVLQESYRFYSLSKFTDDDSIIHYIAHRICTFMNNVLLQGDTDTARITAATGLISGIRSILEKNALSKAANTPVSFSRYKITLVYILDTFQKNAVLRFGDNRLKLGKKVTQLIKAIDIKKVNKIRNEKYTMGEWYSHQFLKIAAEICLMEEDSRGSKNMRNWTSTMLTRLDYFIDNPDCEFMRQEEDLSFKTSEEYLEKSFGIGAKEDSSQLAIVDVSQLSPDILETLTSVIARLIFDYRKKLSGDERLENPVHLILDEAHRYIKKDHQYKLKENIFEKIAREGRKYAYYLLVSSQRPSELSETVLSQCGNYIVHRIQNETDMRYIQAIMPFFSPDFISKIKQAVPGEALIFGNCVPIPLQVNVKQAKPEPSSRNSDISNEWFRTGKIKVQT